MLRITAIKMTTHKDHVTSEVTGKCCWLKSRPFHHIHTRCCKLWLTRCCKLWIHISLRNG